MPPITGTRSMPCTPDRSANQTENEIRVQIKAWIEFYFADLPPAYFIEYGSKLLGQVSF